MNLLKARTKECSAQSFGSANEYSLIEANDMEQRVRAWALTYDAYQVRGYSLPGGDCLWYGLHDALPETTTFLVEHEGRDVAALTLAMDHPVPIPANALYRDLLDDLRREGRRPVEIVSFCNLEMEEEQCMETLKHLLRAAIRTAQRAMNGTDLIILVNPAHAAAYRRIFRFKSMGDIRRNARIGGAPVIPMRLDLTATEAVYREQYGMAEGSFFRFFFGSDENDCLAGSGRRRNRNLPREALYEYFMKRRPILARVPEALLRHVMGGEDPDIAPRKPDDPILAAHPHPA